LSRSTWPATLAQPRGQHTIFKVGLQQGFVTGKIGFGVRLQSSNPEPLMSALGQKRTSQHV